RDNAPQLEVGRSIQNPHPARAKALLEPVMRKHAADERVDRERRLSREHLLRTWPKSFACWVSVRDATRVFSLTQLYPAGELGPKTAPARPGGDKRNSAQG